MPDWDTDTTAKRYFAPGASPVTVTVEGALLTGAGSGNGGVTSVDVLLVPDTTTTE